MTERPTIETPRLLLRPFAPSDAPEVRRLAGEREIALNTSSVPHPYEDGMAEAWIAQHQEFFEKAEHVICAIVERESKTLAGAAGLLLNAEHRHAELGYWIGKPFWGRGYATEAAKALLDYAFERYALPSGEPLERVFARHFGRNPQSGRVLEKIGMNYEGTQKRHFLKWGEFVDLALYGVARGDRA